VDACLPALRATGDGAIVTFSGGGATAPLPRVHAYAASKAGIVRLTENLAAELAEDGITINAIGPGFVATSIHDVVLAAGPERAGPLLPRTERQLAEGGVPTQASAELAVFLLSGDARAISGKLISAEWDDWRDAEFRARLAADPDLATLRRIDDQLYRRVQ
jgi:3-oxoacyl-[acyl-carrier protein] reductase